MSTAQSGLVRPYRGAAETEMGPEEDSTGGVRLRLLDTAERLFGEHGVAETSVRAITAAAGLSVALVNYHFGSKENLCREVVERRQGPLNAERLRLLDACYARAADPGDSGRPPVPDLEGVLHALAVPALLLGFEHPHFARLASRLRLDPDRSLWRDYRGRQQELAARFRRALGAGLPHLEEAEVAACLHFVYGAIARVWAHCPLPPEETPAALFARFVTFYGAGLRAPSTSSHDMTDRSSF